MKKGLTFALAAILLMVSMAGVSAAPVDVVGWDTPYERCLIYSDLYEGKLSLLNHYTGTAGGIVAFKDFYYNYYNTKAMKYAVMYTRLLNL